MLSLAQQEIIERYRHPQFSGVLVNATHTSSGENASCGDEIQWQVLIVDTIIQEIKHTSRACAICTASAELLAERVTGKQLAEVINFTADSQQELLEIPLSPIRQKCALLPLETLKNLKET